MAALAWPLASQSVLSYIQGTMSIAFVGQLGAQSLSATVLGNSVFNVMGLSVMVGISQGLETLCGQAYGAKRYTALGHYLQQGLALCSLFSLGCLGAFLQAPRLLAALGQDPEIARMAGEFLVWMIPALYGDILVECLRRYLVAQNQVHVSNVGAGVSALCTPALLWLFVFRLDLRVRGAALATALAYWINALVHLCYVARFRGAHNRCWPGFSRRAFSGWRLYLGIALPATAMLCAEWWTFEILIILSGLLPSPEVALSAVGVGFQVDVLIFMPTLGFSGALSTRVSNSLGALRPRTARRAAAIATGLTVATSAVAAIGLLASRPQVARVFSPEPEVVAATTAVLLPVAVTCFGDAWQSALAGLLRATRRTGTGAVVAFCSYYLVGIPTAYYFAFRAGLGAPGLWWGLACASNLAMPVFCVIFSTIDWGKEAHRSKELHEHDGEEGAGAGAGGGEMGKALGAVETELSRV